MTDAAVLRRRIDEGFIATERAWRVHLCCHTFGEALRDAQGSSLVPARWHAHRTPACLRGKRGDSAACMEHDLRRLPQEVGGHDACVWRTCHAGIEELIQPVRRAGRLEALIYLNPTGPRGPERRAALEAAGGILAGWLCHAMAQHDEGRACGGDSRLTRIEAFIDGHLAEDPALGALASHLGLSSERARHLVRELSGSSFRALKERRRLETAKRLLTIGFRPVNSIARDCGCADASWFGRWFRQRTGLTPLAWRQQEQVV